MSGLVGGGFWGLAVFLLFFGVVCRFWLLGAVGGGARAQHDRLELQEKSTGSNHQDTTANPTEQN